MIVVPLTQGKVTLIDDEDGPRVLAHKWCAHRCGSQWYAVRRTPRPENRLIRLHRFLMDAPASVEVDHVDGDGLNNQRSTNLRLATKRQQAHNSRSRVGSTSSFKGVGRWQGRWRYQLTTPSGEHLSGLADTEIEAARRYNALAREHFGEYARLNVLPEEPVTA